MTIPDDRLAEIEALYAKATRGVWSSNGLDSVMTLHPNGQTYRIAGFACTIGDANREVDNARCIAAMHNALPELLRGYRAWRAVEALPAVRLGSLRITQSGSGGGSGGISKSGPSSIPVGGAFCAASGGSGGSDQLVRIVPVPSNGGGKG